MNIIRAIRALVRIGIDRYMRRRALSQERAARIRNAPF